MGKKRGFTSVISSVIVVTLSLSAAECRIRLLVMAAVRGNILCHIPSSHFAESSAVPTISTSAVGVLKVVALVPT